jgi:CelD/BcsL family acetyltransferase involved in cellulose biosynthesis
LWVKGEIFRNLADAEGTAREALNGDMQISPFDRFDWFARTMTHCAPAPYPLIARARAEGSDAWLVLAEDGRGKAQAMASWYTLRFGPIFTGAADDRVKGALLTAIARRISKHSSTIRLPTMSEADCVLVTRAFARAGWTARTQETSCNWTIDVAGQSFAQYWADRPGELRSTVKRKGAKAGMDITIHTDFDGVAWADYEAIYAESWKPEEGSNDFLRTMAQEAAADGTLRLGIGRIAGQAVAAQLWTVEHGVAIIHKLAHRESATEFSPGSLMSAAMFERAIDVDRVGLIDFGTGDDRYKSDWMDTRTPLFTLSLFNTRTVTGMAGAAKAKAAALVGRVRTR